MARRLLILMTVGVLGVLAMAPRAHLTPPDSGSSDGSLSFELLPEDGEKQRGTIHVWLCMYREDLAPARNCEPGEDGRWVKAGKGKHGTFSWVGHCDDLLATDPPVVGVRHKFHGKVTIENVIWDDGGFVAGGGCPEPRG